MSGNSWALEIVAQIKFAMELLLCL